MSWVYLPNPPCKLPTGRMNLFIIMLLMSFVMLVTGGIFRIYQYWPELNKRIKNNYYHSVFLPAHRGNLLDRNGRPLAMNADEYHAIAELRVLREKYEEPEKVKPLVKALATVLDMSTEAVRLKLASKKDFIYLKKNISPHRAEALKDVAKEMMKRGEMSRVFRTEYESQRFYPNWESHAHIIGYTDHLGDGQGGAESMWNQQLSATPGQLLLLATSRRKMLQELNSTLAKDGTDWYLSIDSRLQHFAYEALRQGVFEHRARAGAAILMDVATGGLLAIASYPSFNPNKLLRVDDSLRNHALSDVVEPGSTVKPLLVALALEAGVTHPEEVLPTLEPIRIGRLTVRDEHVRENLDVAGVIQKSSNVGAVLLAKRLGKAKVWNWLQTLGFNSGKILGMPEEGAGRVRAYANWRDSDFATHAYGYGFSTTLLQMLRAYSVIATDGILRQPYLEGKRKTRDNRVLSATTARLVRQMMEAVTMPGGTAPAAAVAGYRVAGKTGTSEKFHQGRYDKNKFRAFFIGMAPASNPRYLIAVMVDEPTRRGHTGGAVAAPVFQQIMRRALLVGGIAPDNPAEVVWEKQDV